MVDESIYHIEIDQLFYGTDTICHGIVVENTSSEVLFECRRTNKDSVIQLLEHYVKALNEEYLTKTDSPDVDYYQQGGIECKEYLEAKGFAEGFYRGSAIKYITRAGKKCKDTEIQDLEKARDFINFEIKRLNKLK